jgi:hypothetical protein
MVAEKAADLIRGETPLVPAAVDFYRHPASAPERNGTTPSAIPDGTDPAASRNR